MREDIIEQAVKILKNGGIIAYPTDTIFVIGCDALNRKAVKKIFKLKKRDYSKPLSIACSSIDMAKDYVKIDLNFEQKLMKIFPGPITLILPKKETIPDLITAESTSVGIRVPSYDLIRKIIKNFGRPIITTSANLSGQINVENLDMLPYRVDFIVPGQCKLNQPSTIIDMTKRKIVRKGAGLKIAKDFLNSR